MSKDVDIFHRISNICRSSLVFLKALGSLAQSVEQQAFNLLVLRSNRRRPTYISFACRSVNYIQLPSSKKGKSVIDVPIPAGDDWGNFWLIVKHVKAVDDQNNIMASTIFEIPYGSTNVCYGLAGDTITLDDKNTTSIFCQKSS
jgi:hypothetical protein